MVGLCKGSESRGECQIFCGFTAVCPLAQAVGCVMSLYQLQSRHENRSMPALLFDVDYNRLVTAVQQLVDQCGHVGNVDTVVTVDISASRADVATTQQVVDECSYVGNVD